MMFPIRAYKNSKMFYRKGKKTRPRKNEALFLWLRQLILLWHDDGANDVSQKAGTATEGKDDPQQTDQSGIHFKVFS